MALKQPFFPQNLQKIAQLRSLKPPAAGAPPPDPVCDTFNELH